MIVKLRELEYGPSEFSGEVSAEFLDIEDVNTQLAGNLFYDLEVGVSDGGFWAHGSLRLPVLLTCVNCLEKFETEIVVSDFGMQTELDGKEQIDLTEWLREDILLNLPPYPKCDLGGEKTCPIRFTPVEYAPVVNEKPADSSAWSALDKIEKQNNH